MINKVIDFIKGVFMEMKKVSWTSRKELIGATAAVLILTLIIAIFVGLLDLIFRNLVIFMFP